MKIADFYKYKLKNDLTNKRFNYLKVLYRINYTGKYVYWMCVCDCGSLTKVDGSSLVGGRAKSCGCLRRELAARKFKTHGHSSDGKITRTYTIWTRMKSRCNNKNNKLVYHRYGGRGIKVCERWENSFENFLKDMGDAPDEMTIERIDNDRGYSPDNCKWATRQEQANNTSSNKYYDYNGESLTIAQISRIVGINRITITTRLRRGISFSDAVANKTKTKRLFTHDGMTMGIREWAEYLGIKRRALDSRLNRGWSVEKTLTTPIRGG